jgi:hypothetical protein
MKKVAKAETMSHLMDIRRPKTGDIRHQYPDEADPQPVYLWCHLDQRKLWVECDWEVGEPRAVPWDVNKGTCRRWRISGGTSVAKAHQLLLQAAPLAIELADHHKGEGRLDDRGHEMVETIRNLVQDH